MTIGDSARDGGPLGEASTAPLAGITLVNGRTFVVASADGAIRRPTDGAVFEDLRMLSRAVWHVRLHDESLQRELIGSAQPHPFQATSLSRPDPAYRQLDTGEFYVERQWVGRGLRLSMEVHAALAPIQRSVSLECDTDFAHIFDVKAGVRTTTTSLLTWHGDRGRLAAHGDPGLSVVIECSPSPSRVSADPKSLTWDCEARPGATATITVTFEPHWDGRPAGMSFPIDTPIARTWPIRSLQEWRHAAPTVVSDDPRLAGAAETCLADLASLRIFDPIHADRVVIAAGAPWYMTLFGRDSLLTAWMVMPVLPELALGTLEALAELQGTTTRAESEEEPGKIVHELRRHGGDDAFAERGRYYGTVDATPLFVMVAAEAVRWGHLRGDALISLWPSIRAAIDWCRRHLHRDASGFVRYQRSTDVGLVNQGWKDSWDGISFADGRFPDGAIALAEVQGYTFAALRGAALLARAVPHPELDPVVLEDEADRLAERFDARFWDPRTSSYAVALDGEDNMVDSMTTNPGHAFWCGIADPGRSRRHLDRSMTELFTGWGLRTLSPTAHRYDPLSYHNGSVWPHDTAIVAAGAARAGAHDVADVLVDASLDVADRVGGRPPELFGGLDRSLIDVPVAYPQSCSPQAWSSASTLLNLRTLLGLDPPGLDGRPRIARRHGSSEITLQGIRVADQRFTATTGRQGASVDVEPTRGHR